MSRASRSVVGVTKVRDHAVPAVVHRTWRGPDGRLGIVLANWTDEAQSFDVDDARFAEGCRWIESAGSVGTSDVPAGRIALRLAPHASGALVTPPPSLGPQVG